MKIKRNKTHYSGSLNRIRGFTIIEFLVASALGIIVLIAVGSGYFTTQRLNDVALARLNVQQDLRNASNLIVRDARMAGSFGCFSLANSDATVNSNDGAEPLTLSGGFAGVTGNQTSGVKLMRDPTVFNDINGFQALASDTPVLLFQYGVGSASVTTGSGGELTINQQSGDVLAHVNNNMPLIISSCLVLDRPSSFSVSGGNISNISPALSTAHNPGEMSIMKYAVNAYTLGQVAGATPGLYRFQLNDQGSWDGPELLIKDITGINILFGYVNNCGTTTESFTFVEDPHTDPAAGQPALLHIRLLAEDGEQALVASAENGTTDSAGSLNIYNIDTTIRGGNVCADR
ncbi:MAG: hypothetical protein WBO82_05300 [Neisseria sp.]